tara:strand:- start:1170 stop:1460 length:291 start_codon:yes stop_codon:yes gene_type:complete
MSLSKKTNIVKIRKKLDLLDNKLLDIINKRTGLVKKILQNKSSKKQIVDKRRIKIILKNIKKKSIKRKIDPKLTEMIWKGMIKGYINYEYRNFKKK